MWQICESLCDFLHNMLPLVMETHTVLSRNTAAFVWVSLSHICFGPSIPDLRYTFIKVECNMPGQPVSHFHLFTVI